MIVNLICGMVTGGCYNNNTSSLAISVLHEGNGDRDLVGMVANVT